MFRYFLLYVYRLWLVELDCYYILVWVLEIQMNIVITIEPMHVQIYIFVKGIGEMDLEISFVLWIL